MTPLAEQLMARVSHDENLHIPGRRLAPLVKELEDASEKCDESRQRYLARERRTEKITASKVLKRKGTVTLSQRRRR